MEKLITTLGTVVSICLGFMVVAVVFGFLTAFPVKWLYNYAAVSAFGLHKINVWQAWSLMTLCSLLFKSNLTTKAKE